MLRITRSGLWIAIGLAEDGCRALYIGPSPFLKLPNEIIAKFVWSARAREQETSLSAITSERSL